MNKIIQGDCLDKLKELEDNSIDSIVTDPPYELGFMGKSWDNTGIANNKDMWAECLRVLKPGGHLLAFSGTRTYHRMASAIEDAGFEVRDMIEWVYGSGFPKSLNIAKQIEKSNGILKETTSTLFNNPNGKRDLSKRSDYGYKYEPKHEQAKQWEGWGTALKPAHEPICMARKPLSEKTVAENCLKWGTGGINIDESRVEGENTRTNSKSKNAVESNEIFKGYGEMKTEIKDYGRFPANLILSADEDGQVSEEVRECFPNESERFFKSIIYQAKASKSERNKGCEDLYILKDNTPKDDIEEIKHLLSI